MRKLILLLVFFTGCATPLNKTESDLLVIEQEDPPIKQKKVCLDRLDISNLNCMNSTACWCFDNSIDRATAKRWAMSCISTEEKDYQKVRG